MKITNINRDRPVDFTLPQKSGGVKVVSIRSGQTENVDIQADDLQVRTYLHTGQIATGAEATKAAVPVKPAVS